MFLIDSHCHIHTLNYKKIHKNINVVLKNAYLNNVKLFLAVSTSIQDFKKLIEFTKEKKNIFLSCGLYPLYKHKKSDILEVEKLSKKKNVIAIGETGLDFLNSTYNKKKQIYFFRKHINISKKLKKPLIIHSRNAKKKTIQILYEEKAQQCSGILHCFNEDINMARKLLDLNFYISFSGIITFKNSYNLQKILNFIPNDRILIETDSPYLSPEPVRNKENQPSYLYYIAKCISKYKKIDYFNFVNITKENFFKLFNIISY